MMRLGNATVEIHDEEVKHFQNPMTSEPQTKLKSLPRSKQTKIVRLTQSNLSDLKNNPSNLKPNILKKNTINTRINSMNSIKPEEKPELKKFSIADILAHCRGVDPKDIEIENELVNIKDGEKVDLANIKEELTKEVIENREPSCYRCSKSSMKPWYKSNDSNMFVCRDCHAAYSSLSEMRKHLESHEVSRKTCQQCPLTFSCSLCLSQHVKESHESDQYQCHNCGKSYPSKFRLARHMSQHRGKQFACPYCRKAFPYKNSLRYHCNKHLGITFSCAHCSYFTFTKEPLKKHLESHKQMEERHCFACPQCSKVFTSSSALKSHMKVVHALSYGKHKCEECNKKFATLFNLKTHMNMHRGYRFTCKYCPKQFNFRTNWKEHELKHEGANFTCTLCNKNFSRRPNLIRHVKDFHNMLGIVKNELVTVEDKNCDGLEIKQEPKEHTPSFPMEWEPHEHRDNFTSSVSLVVPIKQEPLDLESTWS